MSVKRHTKAMRPTYAGATGRKRDANVFAKDCALPARFEGRTSGDGTRERMLSYIDAIERDAVPSYAGAAKLWGAARKLAESAHRMELLAFIDVITAA